ncbi:TlpA disulfide reductase family protein [Draconibacterium sp. IB214405]|uniref:TlpA family protein disulfide reductase n=1 Tax=Draconibacterium sp. IB214405 TaxID=3097352 RepID=UPI002A0F787D|nr:TlpA disulfide reductase family protein [Draconibacterium sp. IB214405]MDX8339077.1 TlpA disulfide reductase family protein [Draconibacterium sp. IB214405]
MKKLMMLTLLAIFAMSTFAQDEFTLVKEGDTAPDFTITMEDGSVKKLSDLKGKVVWVNFFATWCPPCRKELPHLEKEVYEKLKKNTNFEVLVIGREHDWETVNKFKADNNYSLPFYPDPDRAIFSKYAKQNIPRNFIIDKDGKIAVASIGFEEEEFNKIIKKVNELIK